MTKHAIPLATLSLLVLIGCATHVVDRRTEYHYWVKDGTTPTEEDVDYAHCRLAAVQADARPKGRARTVNDCMTVLGYSKVMYEPDRIDAVNDVVRAEERLAEERLREGQRRGAARQREPEQPNTLTKEPI